IAPASPAAAAPTFKLPFRCGEVWSGQTRTNHSPANAIDFNRTGDDGMPVASSAPGTVSVVRDLGGTSYGKYVVVDHGGGYSTLYAHLKSWTVAVGDRLEYGTRIGYVGSTGGSTGPHLHYEQRLNGSAIKIRFDGAEALYWGTKNYTSSNECGANLYSPQMVCGSGFNVINSRGLVSNGVSYGKVYVLYNSGNGNNCAVTLKHRNLGSATSTSVYLEPQGGTRATDSGSFSWYAGPVKKNAPGTCIKWGGSVSGVAFNSAWSHCG
ncbi:MAG TPA: M23 family metallopeptidase, partial [Micromonosporaceae bacterium]|nr:M23 family metallopeptidase [Micromonosporaceae bacterium]